MVNNGEYGKARSHSTTANNSSTSTPRAIFQRAAKWVVVLFKDDKIVWISKVGNEETRHEEDYIITDAKKLKTFETVAWSTDNYNPTKWLGVYDLQGDSLKLYFGPDERWLQTFESELKSQGPRAASVYLELKREQPTHD